MSDITKLKDLLPKQQLPVSIEAMDSAIRSRHTQSSNRSNLVLIRSINSHDSLHDITALLHRAYRRLADMGLNFTAVDQTVEITAKRVADGQCFVAEVDGNLAGTITVCGPYDAAKSQWALQTDWFYRKDTAHFHQLGVEPRFQGHGIGDKLVQSCEDWALQQGYTYMALDTAIPAMHLRKRYERLGYRDVGEVQWDGKVYRSVIMVKDLKKVNE